MKNCCNVTNPLRRDGTSQKQRFPLALAESYVQIDERTHAVVAAFQRHFRPARVDGVADASTITTLRDLIAALPAHPQT